MKKRLNLDLLSINYKILIIVINFFGNILLFNQSAYSSEVQVEITDEFERIMEVSYSTGDILTDGAICYEVNGVWYLPIYQVIELLGMAIKVSSELGVVDGFVIDEEKKLHIEINKCEFELKGSKLKYECKKILKFMDDIYITSDLLEIIFPLKLKINSLASKIVIESLEDFPSLAKIKRGSKKIEKRDSKEFDPGFSVVHTNYDWINGFFWDQNIRGLYSKTISSTKANYGLTTNIAGELLKMKAKYSTSILDNQFLFSILTFSKMDQESNLLGPLHASQFQLNNVVGYTELDIGTNGPMIGGTLSNTPITTALNFSNQRFTGPLLPGWEVELYQNESLINRYTNEGKDKNDPSIGRYFFEDVPLYYGENKFRLIFYGPQGQKKIENQHFNISQNVISDSSGLIYRLSYGKNKMGFANYYLSFERYLSLGLSGALGTQNIFLTSSKLEHKYNFLKLNGYFSSFTYQTNYIMDEKNSGNALRFIVSFPIFSWRVRLENINYNKFQSNLVNLLVTNFNTDRYLIKKQNLTLNGLIPYVDAFSSDIIIQLEQDSFNYKNLIVTNRLNKLINGISFRNSLVRRQIFPNSQSIDYIDTFTFGLNVFKLNIQTESTVGYSKKLVLSQEQLPPRLQTIRSITSMGDKDTGILNINYTLALSQSTKIHTLGLGFAKFFKKYQVTANSMVSSAKMITLSLGLSFSFARIPDTFNFNISPANQADLAGIDVHTYLDKNANNTFDSEDEDYPNLEIKLYQRSDKFVTDTKGHVYLHSVSPAAPVDVAIVPSSIKSINIYPSIEGLRVRPLSSKITKIELPLGVFAEVAGSVDFKNEKGEQSPQKSVSVEIYRKSTNEFIKFAYTNALGEYVISRIGVGEYYLTINKKFLQDRGRKVMNDKIPVTVTNESDYVDIEKIIIEKHIWEKDDPNKEEAIITSQEELKEDEKENKEKPISVILTPQSPLKDDAKIIDLKQEEKEKFHKGIENLEKEVSGKLQEEKKEKIYSPNEDE